MQAFLQSPLRILSLQLTHVLKHNICLKNQFQQLILHFFPDHCSQTATKMPEWWNHIWLPILFETHPWQPEDLTAPLEWSWNSSPRTMTRPLERVVWLVWLDRSSESSDWVGNKNEDQVISGVTLLLTFLIGHWSILQYARYRRLQQSQEWIVFSSYHLWIFGGSSIRTTYFSILGVSSQLKEVNSIAIPWK